MEVLQKIQIERREKLSPETFQQEYLAGSGRPVIVTDAMVGWKALSKWNLDYFKSQFGSDTVIVEPTLNSKVSKVMKLADYIDYIETPSGKSPGFWIDVDTDRPLSKAPECGEVPLYLYSWNPIMRHPELLDDVEVTPYFVEDWIPFLTPATRELLRWATPPYYWIFVGREGSPPTLHQDFGGTHAYLAQVTGRKKCTLFSPQESELIYQGRIDPEKPDLSRFPLLAKATFYEGILAPGEMLFIPAGWWHYVRVLEKSITFSYDFFNRANFGNYVVEFLRDLPITLEALERFPEWRASLGIRWSCRGFDFPDQEIRDKELAK